MPDSTTNLSVQRFVAVSSHAVIDFLAVIVVPLLTVIESQGQMSKAQGALLLTIGGLSAGSIQPFVAWLSDRHDTRFFGPAGLAVAAIGMGALPLLSAPWQFFLVQAVAQAGIGAYHPIGAASVGALYHNNRSFGISIFFVLGMVGHFLGNMVTPWAVSWGGIKTLHWLIPFGVVAALVLWHMVRHIPHRHEDAHTHVESLEVGDLRRRWIAIFILYVINVIRFTVNMMLIYFVIRWAEGAVMEKHQVAELTDALRTEASKRNGIYQAAMIVGMGTGGLAAGRWVKQGHERLPIFVFAMLGAVFITIFPYLENGAAYACAIGMGIGYASSIPLTIAMSQRLLPHRTSLATSLMLGCAWIVAAFGPTLGEWLLNVTTMERAFLFTAIGLAVSGALAAFLSHDLLVDSTRLGTNSD